MYAGVPGCIATRSPCSVEVEICTVNAAAGAVVPVASADIACATPKSRIFTEPSGVT